MGDHVHPSLEDIWVNTPGSFLAELPSVGGKPSHPTHCLRVEHVLPYGGGGGGGNGK